MMRSHQPDEMHHCSSESNLIFSSKICRPMQVKKQFLKWVLDWENRVFPSTWKGQHQYCFNVLNCRQMSGCVNNYQINSGEEIGQDRLAWTVFAKALLREHQKVKYLKVNYSCSLTQCLYVLVWISYILRFSNCKLVKIVLKEILICTQSINFLFTYLPGMPLSLYISNIFEDKDSNFEENLCKEFLSLVCENDRPRMSKDNMEVYRWAKPFIFYQVENLSPLHGALESNGLVDSSCNQVMQTNNTSTTLICLLNRRILPSYKHNILTLAIKYNDISLIHKLLQLGVSASYRMWDPVNEEAVTPERMMISNINSIMASQQLLSGRENLSVDVLGSVLKMKNDISSYARKVYRSLLHPESLKATNVWNGEKWKTELNKEIADEWGIGFDRPFPSLQFMTKFCVRQQILLVDREVLPVAIDKLPIPNLLKCYLNLELN